MRMITILAAGSALMLSMAASAQQQPSPQPRPPAAAPQAPATAPAIRSVNVVDITELPEATQSQVNQVVSQRGDAELQKLRTAIDGAPNIKSALQAKGLSSVHVLIAQMNDEGTLTLVTKRAG
jgi:hypothetical protein